MTSKEARRLVDVLTPRMTIEYLIEFLVASELLLSLNENDVKAGKYIIRDALEGIIVDYHFSDAPVPWYDDINKRFEQAKKEGKV